MRKAVVAGVGLVAVLALSGCGGGEESEASECETAVAFLAESNQDEEYQATHTFEATDDAILACDDLAAFEAAVEDAPEAVEGDPAELVANRCEYGEQVAEAAACDEV